MEDEVALDLISVTKEKQGKEISPWLWTGSHQYRINGFVIAHTTMTRGPVNRHDAGSVRLLFSDIHEGLVLVQISRSWDDKESDWLHLILFRV
jgi:hypothetical protein